MSALSIQDLNFYQNDLTEEETVTGGWDFHAVISTSIASGIKTNFPYESAAGAAAAAAVAVGKNVYVSTGAGVS